MNVLRAPSDHPHAAIAFDQIQPKDFADALEHHLSEGRRRVVELTKKTASFGNTIEGLEACTEEVDFVFGLMGTMLLADSTPELQKINEEFAPKVTEFHNDILFDPQIFAAVDQIFNQRESLQLEPERRQLVERTHRLFRRAGAGLSSDEQKRLREIDRRLSVIGPLFRQNVLKSVNAYDLWVEREHELTGLPESDKAEAKERAVEKGQPSKWLLKLHGHTVMSVLKFADSRDLREKTYRAYNSRCLGGEFDNQPLIYEIVELMHERARRIGFPSYLDYALADRMASNRQEVLKFLDRLLLTAKPAMHKEFSEIQKTADSMGGPKAMQAWDFRYYAEREFEKRYQISQEALRPYFALDQTLRGMFEVVGRLYDLRFTESKAYPVYHPDVRVFEVCKDVGGNKEFIGLFYADFFARDSKSPGAWMANFYEQGRFRGVEIRPHVTNVCNFSKPVAGQPALLTFEDVLTLFHEFGHALHGLMSKVRYRSIAGTNVHLDFVELPSQIFENWALQEETLNLFARHNQTGEKLPKEWIAKIKESRQYLAGFLTMRQLQFAYLDIAYFESPNLKDKSIVNFENIAIQKVQILPPVENTCISTSFTHIFGSMYSAGYYSYKWAEALDADAFELFNELGLFNKEAARRFEENILTKGGSLHPMELYERFRGRRPDPEALLRRDGLLA